MVPHAKNATVYTLPCQKKTRNPENGVANSDIFWHWVRPLGFPCSMFVLEDGVLSMDPMAAMDPSKCLRIMGLWFHEAPKRRSEFQRMVDWWPGVLILESYLIVTISVTAECQSLKAPRSHTSQWLVGSSYFETASPNQIRRYRECGQPWLPSTYHFSRDVNSIQPIRRVIFGGWLSWQIYRNYRNDPPAAWLAFYRVSLACHDCATCENEDGVEAMGEDHPT